MIRSMTRGVFALGATGALALTAALPASASGTPTIKVLSTRVLAPFQLAASDHLYASDGFKSVVYRSSTSGLKVVAKGPKTGEVSGVAVGPNGDLAYTTTDYKTGKTALTIRSKSGKTVVANLSAYEKKYNPDAKVSYGIDNPTDCQKKAFKPLGGASTKGIVDSHPYAVTSYWNDSWIVAEAGGNDLLRVTSDGRISTVAVLPPQPSTITKSAAKALGLPKCVVGAVYKFDPVPTDVEVAGDGSLAVSLLPGGPESPALGARGSVWKVDPNTGGSWKTAGGFLGATNLALDDKGRIYVAELFGSRISVIENDKVRKYVSLKNVVSLVWKRGTLYAGTLAPTDDKGNPTGKGSLVAIR